MYKSWKVEVFGKYFMSNDVHVNGPLWYYLQINITELNCMDVHMKMKEFNSYDSGLVSGCYTDSWLRARRIVQYVEVGDKVQMGDLECKIWLQVDHNPIKIQIDGQ